MGFLFVNTNELSALMGLPHIQQAAYLLGIRPYMDRETFLVGIKRKISYQSLAETLYIEPHQGLENSGSPSRPQLRRIIYALERAGLIEIRSNRKNLILKCILADSDSSVQNKPDTNPSSQPDRNSNEKNHVKSIAYNQNNQKPDTPKNINPDTPHNSENNFFYLRQQFEKFWTLYPIKLDEVSAFQEFSTLKPNEELLSIILSALDAQIQNRAELEMKTGWAPYWKYPAKWLAQQCWNDELLPIKTQELKHATHQNYPRKKSAADILAERCKDASFDFEDNTPAANTTNIVQFNKHRSQ
ncbi:hypothetical protein [Legionella septentrionalis]|uniref:Protein LvrA n=1 Tax=Legionella septentrionalis TaxID=2498109 RepID=A0A3S0V533_9GAMM|nr:hypothetical protein [Legionella septentrionalis]RUQ85146.1 hypothetical protein EKM59_07480 [Legionella septentrionalis]